MRRCLVCGGLAAMLAGGLLILAMPLSPAARAGLGLLWITSSMLELCAQRSGMARICRIRIQSDGQVDAVAPNGERHPLELLPGSIVLSNMAWLRLRFPDGRGSAEWLRSSSAGAGQWRVLRLIWRQRAGLFGRLERS